MTREEKIMTRVNEHYKELEKRIRDNGWGCKIFGLFLQGSQNYNLDEYSEDYQSDVDTKAIVIPSTNDLIHGIRYSTTLVLDNNEHIDVKDIQTMFTMFRKQNPSYLELLFTDYKIINKKYTRWWESIYLDRERIVRLDPIKFLHSACGSAYQKYKVLSHVSPHSAEKIEKFGYDPKELCHLIRYEAMITRYLSGKDFKTCIMPEDAGDGYYLMQVKKGTYFDLAEATELAEGLNHRIKMLYDRELAAVDNGTSTLKKDIEIDQLLTDVLEATLRYNIRLELGI